MLLLSEDCFLMMRGTGTVVHLADKPDVYPTLGVYRKVTLSTETETLKSALVCGVTTFEVHSGNFEV